MIEEFIARTWAIRDAAHMAHWATSSGFHHQSVLGPFYEGVIGYADRVTEALIGNFNSVPTVKTISQTLSSDKDIVSRLKKEVAWIEKNRNQISMGISGIEAIIDELIEFYLSTLFKLRMK